MARSCATVGTVKSGGSVRGRHTGLVAGILLGTCLLLGVASLLMGAVAMSPGDLAMLLSGGGRMDPVLSARLDDLTFIILQIRLPRTLAALGAGAALGASGAAMQGLFRNPLAGPDILGVNAGASLGALLSITSGLASLSVWMLPAASLAGAAVVSVFVFAMGRGGRNGAILRVVLAGMAVSSLAGGITSLVLSLSPVQELRQFIFWTMGGLDGRTWAHVLAPAVPLGIAVAILVASAPGLDLLAMGDEHAFAAGLETGRFRPLVMGASALACAMAVVMAGPVAFIGLMVPHMVRMANGPAHRSLLALSPLAGAAFLLAADLAGRLILPGRELKAGIITALVGGPYFLFLLWKDLRRRGW